VRVGLPKTRPDRVAPILPRPKRCCTGLRIGWVAIIGAVSARDVMARFGVGRTVAYRRLARLVDYGLLACSPLVYGQPALDTATREGLAWAPYV
jgi:hypothetical protein